VELAIERGQGKEAWQQLSAISSRAALRRRRAIAKLQARAALASGRPEGGSSAQRRRRRSGRTSRCCCRITGRAGGRCRQRARWFHDGVLQAPAGERPRVRVYDTARTAWPRRWPQAARQGADFIVGPLTRERGGRGGGVFPARAPLLALNFLPAEQPARRCSIQYALSPRRGAPSRRGAYWTIITAAESRVLGARRAPPGRPGAGRFQTGAARRRGELLGTALIDAVAHRLSGSITEVLRISDSTARHRRLESALGTKLQFRTAASRRHRVHLRSGTGQRERLLRPAGCAFITPATSHLRGPPMLSNRTCARNQDLDGLMFPNAVG